MDAKDIPQECLNNTQFSMVLKATLETEIKQKQQKIKDIQKQIEAVKKSVEYKYNERKKIKHLLEVEKAKKAILEPTLKVLTANYEEKKLELKLLEAGLDSDSLRMKDEQKKCEKIVENYKKTWEEYQAEYEKSELAIKRKEVKTKVERAKVQLMVSQFKKERLFQMLKQREAIGEMRLKAMITEMSHLILDRWKQQNYQDELKNKIDDLNKQYNEICEKHRKVQQKVEEEATARALARQLMPAPRVDSSILRSVYATTPRSTEPKINRELSVGPAFSDTMSVNSSILEQLCSGNENVLNKVSSENEEEQEEEEEEESLTRGKSFRKVSQSTDADGRSTKNLQNECQINSLENVCRQLSIDEESTCDECHEKEQNADNVATNTITCEAIIEAPRQPESQQAFSGPVPNALKKKPLLHNESMHTILEKPERKRSKMSDCSHENLLWPSKSSDLKSKAKESSVQPLPKIKKIETLNRPIKLPVKPPTAEVPPTPSNLFPNRHYATSCASNDSLSMMGEGNYNEIDSNWQNFTPPHRADSGMSFMSDTSMFKSMVTPAMSISNSEVMSNKPEVRENKPLQPTKQPDEPPKFFNYFGGGKRNTQAFF